MKFSLSVISLIDSTFAMTCKSSHSHDHLIFPLLFLRIKLFVFQILVYGPFWVNFYENSMSQFRIYKRLVGF